MLANVIMPMVMLLTPPEPVATREVDVTIRLVEAEGGKPIPELHMIGLTRAGHWWRRTDAEGVLRARVRVAEDEDRLWIQPTRLPPRPRDDAPIDGLWSLAMPARVELAIREDAGSFVCEGDVRFEPATVIEGRVIGPDGSPLSGNARTDAWSLIDSPIVGGVLRLPGTPRLAEVMIQVSDRTGMIWWHRVRTGAELRTSLGEIRFEKAAATGLVSARIVRLCFGDARKNHWSGSKATLLAVDGWSFFALSVHAEQPPPSQRELRSQERKVPVGTYIAVSGDYSVLYRVRDAILAGEDVVKKWGLQRVEVREGERLDLVIDDEAVYKAVMGELPPTINWTGEALVSPTPTPTPTPAPTPTPTPTKAPVPPEEKERGTRK